MKKTGRFVICILAAFLGIFLFVGLQFAPVVEAAPTRTLYLMGDSWTAQPVGFGTFDKILAARNLSATVKVENHAVSGSTAAEWVADQDGRMTNLTNAIKNDPLSNPVVYMTLGGNDLLRIGSRPTEATYAQVGMSVRTVLSQVVATRDDVTVVLGGYDITNPAADSGNPFVTCTQILEGLFNTTNPADVNPLIVALFTTLSAVADEFDNVYAVNTYGSLQGNPGMPDLSQWSPVGLIADCIHPNSAGYDLHLKTVFDARLESLLAASTGPLDRQIFLPIIIRAE